TQMSRSESKNAEQPSDVYKTPRYQTTEMHYEWRFERLARYVSRPAVSTERLSELPDGRLLYRLKRRWRNGTTEVVFDRSDFIAKLAALAPASRAHLRTYHGILAPAAKWRHGAAILAVPRLNLLCPSARYRSVDVLLTLRLWGEGGRPLGQEVHLLVEVVC